MGDKSNPAAPNASSSNNNAASRDPSVCNEFIPQAPPPSYEESQRMSTSAQQPEQKQPLGPNPMPSAPPSYGIAVAQPFTQQYGYPNPYHLHMQQQQSFLQQQHPQQAQPQTYVVYQPTQAGQNRVLQFDSSAVVTRNANGAVIVPPPPPGCAPTAAQLAAMQGQQVLVKKKKKSFF